MRDMMNCANNYQRKSNFCILKVLYQFTKNDETHNHYAIFAPDGTGGGRGRQHTLCRERLGESACAIGCRA